MPPLSIPSIRTFGGIFGDEYTGLSQEWFLDRERPIFYKMFQPACSYFLVIKKPNRYLSYLFLISRV